MLLSLLSSGKRRASGGVRRNREKRYILEERQAGKPAPLNTDHWTQVKAASGKWARAALLFGGMLLAGTDTDPWMPLWNAAGAVMFGAGAVWDWLGRDV